MAEKSPTVQPTRQRNVLIPALFHVGLDDQNAVVRGDREDGFDDDEHDEDSVLDAQDEGVFWLLLHFGRDCVKRMADG